MRGREAIREGDIETEISRNEGGVNRRRVRRKVGKKVRKRKRNRTNTKSRSRDEKREKI